LAITNPPCSTVSLW